MKHVLLLFLALACLAYAGTPTRLSTGTRLEIVCTDFGGDGGAVQAGGFNEGTFLFRTLDNNVNVCVHDGGSANPDGCEDGGRCRSCPSGGEPFGPNAMLDWQVDTGGNGFSCRSADGGGRIVFTLERPR